ncbi:sigma-70 family RNA polymerase sigma factor [Oceaniglobus trochenteri]|uniref:sigma-70 family RNA polymerase sigma factor n=1 Tax=Oceaniglobus trochenteri TaxID=2763260 RepID=UPI001CFFF8CA|nr:sigma-70 family RNA polymerase sigma factor [Oceaniglobus trochenteri]
MRTTQDIEHMILAMAEGDRAAFLSLYDATSAKLFGICLRVLNDRAEAEDVLQEIFLKIWRNADRYKANGFSPMTWLITVARNGAIDRLRTRKRRGESLDLAEELPDHAPTPEAAAVASSERDRVQGCLGELKPERAGAVKGAYLDGQTYQELADRYGVPLNTMRTWLRRSLQSLKECLSR